MRPKSWPTSKTKAGLFFEHFSYKSKLVHCLNFAFETNWPLSFTVKTGFFTRDYEKMSFVDISITKIKGRPVQMFISMIFWPEMYSTSQFLR